MCPQFDAQYMAGPMGYTHPDAFHRTVARLKNTYPFLNIQSTTSGGRIKAPIVDAYSNSLKRAQDAEAKQLAAEAKKADTKDKAEGKKKVEGEEPKVKKVKQTDPEEAEKVKDESLDSEV